MNVFHGDGFAFAAVLIYIRAVQLIDMELRVTKHMPSPQLSDFVESILYVEGNNRGAGLPKTAMSLVFNLDDDFRLFDDGDLTRFTDYRRHWVAGLQTVPRHVESYGASRMIVVQFRLVGASAFLRPPLFEFTDRYVELDCVVGRDADETWERLKSADVCRKFVITEQFLLRHLENHRLARFGWIGGVATRLVGEDAAISRICRDENVSRKHLSQIFKHATGVSPKLLGSLQRFQRVLRAISADRPARLTDLAHDHDYFDQAHFINDFKRFSRLRPSEYRAMVESTPSLRFVPHFLPLL